MDKPQMYRKLPQVGELLQWAELGAITDATSRDIVADAARSVLSSLRDEIRAGNHTEETLDAALHDLCREVAQRAQALCRPSLRKVINATGILLQTNLGRAPLSEQAIQEIVSVASGYCNLEMALETGERSRRDVHAEELILRVLAARAAHGGDSLLETHAAAVVNNCAGATFLALNEIAEGGEVLVSRGELVEIGGGFRVPDILRKSGARLREVGTTNKTRLRDYRQAVTAETRMILRVHRSNFKIEGFTEQPALEDLVHFGKECKVPVFEDQGTGCVAALEEYGLHGESSWVRSVESGVALVAASGDKLLGGPQCGLLVGERSLIERIRANPLYRALRVDKLTYAALNATLLAYLQQKEASVPIVSMLQLSAESVRERCETLASLVGSDELGAEVIAVRSFVGGGTTPGASLPSHAVALRHASISDSKLAARLRKGTPAVVARVHGGRVLLDLRTVSPGEDQQLKEALRRALISTEAL